MNFREELSKIKERKQQGESISLVDKILKDEIIPYIEKKISAEQISEGIAMTIYHCDRQLSIVIDGDLIYTKDFMDAKETTEKIKSLETKFKEEGFEIADATLYRSIIIIKA